MVQCSCGWKDKERYNNIEYRASGDLIQMFKIVNGHDEINLMKGVNCANSLKLNLRRKNDKRLIREITKQSTHRYNFLINRVVTIWNGLWQYVIDSKIPENEELKTIVNDYISNLHLLDFYLY